MLIKEIYVARGSTVNMGNYESEKMEIGMSVEVADSHDKDSVVANLTEILSAYLQDWRDSLKERK